MRTSHAGDEHHIWSGYASFDPGGRSHSHFAGETEGCEFLVARWSGLTDLLRETGPCVVFDYGHRILRQLQWMMEIHPAKNAADEKMLDSLMFTTCYRFRKRINPEPSDLFDKVRSYMREHLEEKIRLDDLAGVAGISKYHLIRKFRKHLGRTPFDLLNQLRFERAQTLILENRFTLDAIAEEVGLVDGSHLSRLFRKRAGRTPGEFRKDALA